MTKILCIGEALIDMICTDRGSSLADGNHFLKKPGGAPTNVAAAIAALGGQVELAAKVGIDPFGDHLVEVMKSFGVSTEWMIRDMDHFTTFAFVSLMENGERDFYFNRGADGHLSIDEINQIDLGKFSITHFGSATGFLPGPLQGSYHTLLERARNEKLFISFDPNYRHLLFQDEQESFISQSHHFLNNCHFFKVSDEEAMLLTSKATLEEATNELLKIPNTVFAVTLGKDGTLLGLNGKTTLVPSIEIDPVDTTGAGDAFVGAVLYQLSQYPKEQIDSLIEKDWINIFINANKAGARTCEYTGAMEAFKHLNNKIFE